MPELAILPLIHPAAVLRGQYEQGPISIEYLRRAREYVQGERDIVELGELPPSAILEPTLQDVQDYFSSPLCREGLAVDIESAGDVIVCIGFTRLADNAYLCLRFRHRNGYTYWPDYRTLYEVVDLTDQAFADPSIPLHFHNGQAFDVPELTHIAYVREEWVGFEVAGFTEGGGTDTMLTQLVAMAGFPKGLQFCGNLHLGMPYWKSLVSEDDEVEGKN